MPIAAVVADANVLLSAVIGKAALRVLTELGWEVHVARFNADEVAEYLPVMAAKYRLARELVDLQWRLLPVILHPERDDRHELARPRLDTRRSSWLGVTRRVEATLTPNTDVITSPLRTLRPGARLNDTDAG